MMTMTMHFKIANRQLASLLGFQVLANDEQKSFRKFEKHFMGGIWKYSIKDLLEKLFFSYLPITLPAIGWLVEWLHKNKAMKYFILLTSK